MKNKEGKGAWEGGGKNDGREGGQMSKIIRNQEGNEEEENEQIGRVTGREGGRTCGGEEREGAGREAPPYVNADDP